MRVEQGGLATAALPQQQAGFPGVRARSSPSNRGSVSPPLAAFTEVAQAKHGITV